ncbi:MAG: FeoA family protein [Gammaproteobacteria bacterium]|nr:FeoA family protein [Gammaproteobacteria bacterium]
MIQTAELQPGYRVRLSHFGQTPTSYRRRLLAIGFRPGLEVTFIRAAPLGCPIYLKAADQIFALRKNEALHLHWEKL